MISASADVFGSVAKRRGKPAWNIDAACDVIDERPFCRLVRFSRDRGYDVPKMLLVAPMSGHHATLLRGTVEALVLEHDVFVTDWIDARDVPLSAGVFNLDTYIDYIMSYLRLLGPHVHAMAVCQPAPAVLAAVALLAADNDPAQPRSMTLMGGPVDAQLSPTAPTKLAESRSIEWFDRELTTTLPPYYKGAGRRVYPGFMQLGAFLSMNPKRHIDAHISMYNELVRGDGESAGNRQRFYDEYMSVMDVTAEYFLQTIETVFQQHSLPRGTLRWHGQLVDPSAIRSTALLTVEGELDDISAPAQTYAAHTLCSSLPADRHDHLLQRGVGHYGIFNGRRWRENIAPYIGAFVRKHA